MSPSGQLVGRPQSTQDLAAVPGIV